MIELSAEQRRELGCGKTIEVTDPDTNESYVLLRKEIYEKVRSLLGDADWTEEDLRTLLARSFRDNGWDEPGMDAYDRLIPLCGGSMTV